MESTSIHLCKFYIPFNKDQLKNPLLRKTSHLYIQVIHRYIPALNFYKYVHREFNTKEVLSCTAGTDFNLG